MEYVYFCRNQMFFTSAKTEIFGGMNGYHFLWIRPVVHYGKINSLFGICKSEFPLNLSHVEFFYLAGFLDGFEMVECFLGLGEIEKSGGLIIQPVD